MMPTWQVPTSSASPSARQGTNWSSAPAIGLDGGLLQMTFTTSGTCFATCSSALRACSKYTSVLLDPVQHTTNLSVSGASGITRYSSSSMVEGTTDTAELNCRA